MASTSWSEVEEFAVQILALVLKDSFQSEEKGNPLSAKDSEVWAEMMDNSFIMLDFQR